MRKKLLFVPLLACMTLGLVGCGEDTDVSDSETRFSKIQSIVSSSYSNLVYDIATKDVYFSDRTSDCYYVHSAYFAPNGKPFRYNIETGNLEEILDSDSDTEYCVLDPKTNILTISKVAK